MSGSESEHVPAGHKVLCREVDADGTVVADMNRALVSDERAGILIPEEFRWRAAWNGDLRSGVNNVRIRARRHEVLVHPRCETLIKHMRNGIWNQKRDAFERLAKTAEPADGLKHFDAFAALMYLLRRVNWTKNPVPWTAPNIVNRYVPPELLKPPRKTISLGRRRA
jgi:hypothetical protein